MSLHALTGCDTTSSLKGIGKVKPIKLFRKSDKFGEILCQLGETWDLEETQLKDIEHFVCCLYGFQRFKSIDQVRVHILRKKCEKNGVLDPKKNIDLANLPPCFSSLKQHIKQVNYQVRIWKLAEENFPERPQPTNHGWKLTEMGLEPLWSEENILPTQLVDLLEDVVVPDTDEEDNEYESDSSDISDIV